MTEVCCWAFAELAAEVGGSGHLEVSDLPTLHLDVTRRRARMLRSQARSAPRSHARSQCLRRVAGVAARGT